MVLAGIVAHAVKSAVARMRDRCPKGMPEYPMSADGMPDELIRQSYGGGCAPPQVQFSELDFNTGTHPIRIGKRATPLWLSECPYPVFKRRFHALLRVPPQAASSPHAS